MRLVTLALLLVSSIAFAKPHYSTVDVDAVSESDCADLQTIARSRLAKAQIALNIEPGTLGMTGEFYPESTARGTCSGDGDVSPICGIETYVPALCRLVYAADGVRWTYKKLKTAKVNGKEQAGNCEGHLSEKQQDPKNLFAEIKYGGIFKRHCRVHTLRLDLVERN